MWRTEKNPKKHGKIWTNHAMGRQIQILPLLSIDQYHKKKKREDYYYYENVKCNVEVLDVFCNMSP